VYGRDVHVTAKVDYAVRAAVELAAIDGRGHLKAEAIAAAHGIPAKYLESILAKLRDAGLVETHRGPHGGSRLAISAAEISIADVMRAVEGPLASVRSHRPETLEYEGLAEPLQTVWVALRQNIRAVLETVTIRALVDGKLPRQVVALTKDREAWTSQ